MNIGILGYKIFISKDILGQENFMSIGIPL